MSERLSAARLTDPATVPMLPVVGPVPSGSVPPGSVPHARAAEAVQPPPPTPERTRKGRRLDGLDLLRALASCMVFYTHISTWYRYKQDPMPFSEVIDDLLIGPLQLNKELGFFGVALFFLISGFVMAHVATKERAGEYGIKRALRIFPALIVAVILAWILVIAGLYAIPGGSESVGVDDLLTNMFLLNFFIDGFAPLVGVAWTLITQLAVYAMIGALLFAFRRAPWVAIAAQITLCSVLLSIAPRLSGLPEGALGNIGSFGPAIVLGQVIWLVWAKKAPLWAGMLLGLACWLVFNLGGEIGYGRYDDSYTLTLTLATLLVILAVVANQRVPRLRVVTYLSSRSYAVYLVHQTLAFTVLALLWPNVPSSVAVAAAIAATLVVAELVHRGVERPFAKLATTLSRRVGR